jgi:cysteine desulfurase
MTSLRDDLEERIQAGIPGARLTVAADGRAPHISSLSFPGLPAEPLLHALEARGVMASAGSACASKVRGPSHVLRAIGVADDTAVLRFSLSRDTTTDEIRVAAQAVIAAVGEIAETFKPDRRHKSIA